MKRKRDQKNTFTQKKQKIENKKHISRLESKLQKGVVFCAEGYIFELERRGYVQAGPYVPEVVLKYPNAVKELHKEFLNCGSDVIEALTYYAHRDKLKQVGLEDKVEELNRNALRIAKEVAKENKEALVAGNVCNTWRYDPKDPKTHEECRKSFVEQIKWASEEGVDFIIGETFMYLGEALIALEVIKQFNLDAVITFITTCDKTFDGFEFEDACKVCEDNGALVVGLNCSRGPKTMMPILKRIRKKCSGYIAALPVPYDTNEKCPHFQCFGEGTYPTKLDSFLLNRDDMADFAEEAVKLGVKYLGICCGAGPHMVRAMCERIGKKGVFSRYTPNMEQHGSLVHKHNRPHNKTDIELENELSRKDEIKL